MKAARPDPPSSLGRRGRALWRSLLSELEPDVEFSSKELELLRLACGQSDLVDALEREIKGQPLAVEGAEGQPRGHPLIAQLTQARIAEARLLTEIRLEIDAAEGLPVRNKRAQRAAQARWRARREVAEQRRQVAG